MGAPAAGLTSPLLQILRSRIAAEGPISVAAYMAECLLHPEHGYYRSQEAIGLGGDFVTAPELSQLFGELLGLWAADCRSEEPTSELQSLIRNSYAVF